jgi:hypothetical protein
VPTAWCTAPNPGSRIPMSTAPRRFCRGMRRRRRPRACRRWKSRRASLARSAKPGTPAASARWRAGSGAHRSGLVRRRSARTHRESRRTMPASPQLTLLEEPAAAFYSWIANNFARSRKLLFDGQIVLICDVGGGTSDFSLIRVSRDGDKIDFTRTAVGKHLLLGGDNLDLTLAWLAESKLGKQLSIRQRSGLRRQCSARRKSCCAIRAAKRRDQRARQRIVHDRRRAEDGDHARRSAGTDARRLPAHHAARRKTEGREAQPVPRTRPALRFRPRDQPAPPRFSNPPARFRTRFCSTAASSSRKSAAARGRCARNWYGKRPEVFENRDLDLAVASGAAYYSYVRSTGSGVLVRGGLPRAYYVGLNDNSPSAWCRAARKKATRSKSIAKTCNWSPTSRSRSA